jgi:tetratricopeptide (TPR) repeat protein
MEAPRVLRVLVSADPKFRERPHWRDVISSRIHEVSAMYDSAFGIRLELAGVNEWSLDGQVPPEPKRRRLGGSNSDGNVILLGFTEPADTGLEPGIAMAFDPRVLVFDYPARSEEQNQIILAHELAHLFGAWHSQEGSSILHLPPGSSFDSNARKVIRLTRLAGFSAGAAGLNRETVQRFNELFAATKADSASNPLFQAYLFIGHELWSTGHHEEAIEPLSQATAFAPRDVNAHFMLGRSNLLMKRFPDAAFQFRQVVALDPRHAPAWNSLGGALVQMGDLEQALAAFQKALEIDPSNQTIRANLGAARVRVPGQLDLGIAELQGVLRDDPDQKDAADALKYALDVKHREVLKSDAPKRSSQE